MKTRWNQLMFLSWRRDEINWYSNQENELKQLIFLLRNCFEISWIYFIKLLVFSCPKGCTQNTSKTRQIQWIHKQYVFKNDQKCQKVIAHPKIPHISRITEQNRPKIGNYSLGRNWAKIKPFWARIRIPNVPKVTQKCQKWIVHPKIPHISRITAQIRPVLQLGQELG